MIDIHEFHKLLGRLNIDTVRRTSKYYDIELKEKITSCENCAIGKIKTTNIPKYNDNKTLIPGERFYCDIIHNLKKSCVGSQ